MDEDYVELVEIVAQVALGVLVEEAHLQHGVAVFHALRHAGVADVVAHQQHVAALLHHLVVLRVLDGRLILVVRVDHLAFDAHYVVVFI